MSEFDINNLVRENIRKLLPYSSARSEFSGNGNVFLDANENSFGSASDGKYNRYPDPLQTELKQKISELKRIPTANIFLGNGSDEAIDLLIRAFCEPRKDNIIIFPPTYGMYEVAANINDVEIREVFLNAEFQINVPEALDKIDAQTKLIFICSPNNPTGNLMKDFDVQILLDKFKGIVVLDEAYIDFAQSESRIGRLQQFRNLVILQTFSKAWGLAGLRIGMAFASEEIISILNKIKAPYNIGEATQQLALNALERSEKVVEWVMTILIERVSLINELSQFPFVKKIYKSDSNFFLVKVTDANSLYTYLIENGIAVRNRSNMILCENCLRITVGTQIENQLLIDVLKKYL